MSEEINRSNPTNNLINNSPTELSEQELDEVSGGIDFFISGSTFEETHISSFNRGGDSINRGGSINSLSRGGTSSFRSSHTFSSAFQIVGLGFDSVGDALGFLSGFARLFGRR
ncbi:MAG: hypothetical protein ACFB02_10380 [Mastigocoleus sp.]